MLQQQDKFEHFMRVYNYERPHEGIEMKIPGDLYQPSSRQYTGLPELAYPFHDRTIVITECGCICMDRKKIKLSSVLAGQRVEVVQVEARSSKSALWTTIWGTTIWTVLAWNPSPTLLGLGC